VEYIADLCSVDSIGHKKTLGHGGQFDQWTALLLVVGNAIPMFIFAILLIVFFVMEVSRNRPSTLDVSRR